MRLLSHSLGMLLAALALLATGSPAPAQTSWQPSAGGNWFDGANWDLGIPNGVSAFARFARVGSGSQTVNVNGAATVGQIRFGPESGSSNFAHTLSGGGITLNNGGPFDSLIERTRTDGTSDIQTPLTIAGNNVLTLTNSGHPASGVSSLTPLIIGSLSGTNSTVTINPTGTVGPGVVIIQSGNYGGVTNVQGSVLRAADGVGLPSTTSLRLNGGGWELPTTATITRSLGAGPGQIQLTGPQAGFTAFNGPVTIRLNGGGQVQWGSPTFNPTTLVLGRGVTAGGSDSYTFENGLDLNGAVRTIALGVGAGGIRAHAVFSGNIVNNNGFAASGLTVTGAGGGGATLELTGTNTYNGTTTVQLLTVLRANEGAGLSPNTTLVLNDGLLEGVGAATFSRNLGSAAGRVRVIGGSSGFSARGGTHTIRLNGGTGTVVWGSADFNPTTALQFHSFTSDALVDFQNGINLNGASRLIRVGNNLASSTDVARISGVISNSTGTANLIVGGNGVLELTAANTYNGETVVFDTPALPGNTLRLTGIGSFANSPVVTVGTGRFLDVSGLTGGANYSTAAGRFQLAPGQTLAGIGTVTGNALVGPGATIRGGSPPTGLNAPTGQLAVNGSLRIAGAATASDRGTLAVDLNGATASGATVSRVAVTGAGNVFDLDTTTGPVTLRLVNDQALTLNQSYSFVIGSSAGGFTRSGTTVTSYTHGTDFVMESANFAFSDVTLTVGGANDLVLAFTVVPVPEPGAVVALCAGAAGLAGVVRRVRRRFAE